MRFSVLLSAAFAANAMAIPARLDKRVYVTDVEVVTVTEFVTDGYALPEATLTVDNNLPVQTFLPVSPAPFENPPPPPPPPPPRVPTVNPVVIAPPTTKEAPKQVEIPQSKPEPTTKTTDTPAPASQPAPPVNVANLPSSPAPNGGFNFQPLCHVPSGIGSLTTTPSTDAARKWLAYTNTHRTNHTTCSMYWDYALEAEAKQAANTCVYAHTKSNGQNMAEYTVFGTQITADNLTDAAGTFSNMYYSEGQYYSGQYGLPTPSTSQDVGHFTQMIWKDSYSVGCATTQCGSMLLSFCNYSPGGNILTTYASNVHGLVSPPLPPLCAETGGTTGCITDAQLGL